MYSVYSYDPKENTVYMQAAQPVTFTDVAELDAFYTEMLDYLKQLPTKPYMLAEVTGMTISPRVADRHGEWMKNHILPALLGLVRYGEVSPLHEISVRTQAVKRDYEVIILPDLETALQVLAQLKAQQVSS